jgi:hypothetical protein
LTARFSLTARSPARKTIDACVVIVSTMSTPPGWLAGRERNRMTSD